MFNPIDLVVGDAASFLLSSHYPAKVIPLYFHPLEVVSRYRDSQMQVGKNYLYLFNLSTNI